MSDNAGILLLILIPCIMFTLTIGEPDIIDGIIFQLHNKGK